MSRKLGHRLLPIAWVLGGVTLALVLIVSAVLICTVKVLKPESLTALVVKYSNSLVDARVDIERVALDFHPVFPKLRLRVDGLDVISHKFDSMPDSLRKKLPVYSDSLLSVRHFEGTVDIGKFLTDGEIALHNVLIESPSANIVIAREGSSNYDIYAPGYAADETSGNTDELMIPAISINHFEIKDCRELRYFNALDSTDATIVLLDKASLEGIKAPSYKLGVGGIIRSPMVRDYVELDGLSFGIDGSIKWRTESPFVLGLEDFRLESDLFKADITADVDFAKKLVVKSGRIDIDPVDIMSVVSVLPEDIRRKYRLKKPFFSTDATVSLSASLNEPFDMSVDTIPYADYRIEMPESFLDYGHTHLQNMALAIEGNLQGNDLDKALVRVSKLNLAGPATELNIEGVLSRLISDPAFDCSMKGQVNLSLLPQIVLHKLDGYISGRLNADFAIKGSASMFSGTGYHRLNVSGRLDGDDLYWLSGDTANMVNIGHLGVDFDTNRRVSHEGSSAKRLMSAGVTADTASMLFGGVEINIADLALRAGVQNASRPIDSTALIPVGGGLSLGSLRVVSVTDKAGLRMRGLEGKVMMRRYNKNAHIPEFILDIDAERLAAGGGGTVGMLAKAGIYVKGHMIPERGERRRRMKATIDSLSSVYPQLSPDSVLALAVAKRRAESGRKQKRVRMEKNDDFETIDWGASKGLRRFLNDWVLNGEISTSHARLYTPYFPLKNRVNRLDISFSTDTVNIRSLNYRAGNSNMDMTGLITNIKKSFGSKRVTSPLKVNFEIVSDTIDVNELAAATFSGSTYAGDKEKNSQGFSIDDANLEDEGDDADVNTSSSSAPILIPSNIEANIGMNAANILYSDLVMKNLKGDILVYDGAVNLHNLAANSDAGSMSLSALYSAPNTREMQFGFGMMLDDFRIEKFLSLVPAVDSIMPLIRDFSGTVDADIAATVRLDSTMNFELPTLDAAIKLKGDSLALINPETYRTLGKWLRFKDKADNKIKHMEVECIVRDNKMELFPFTFNIDRYKLGVVGYNDLAFNFNYHISVLKSPLPFKFGINVKGNPDKYKVRFGGAKLKDGSSTFTSMALVDTVRVNLVRQIQNVFRRGISNSRFATLHIAQNPDMSILTEDERQLSHNDSVALIREGYIEAPVTSEGVETEKTTKKDKKKKSGRQKKENNDARGKDD